MLHAPLKDSSIVASPPPRLASSPAAEYPPGTALRRLLSLKHKHQLKNAAYTVQCTVRHVDHSPSQCGLICVTLKSIFDVRFGNENTLLLAIHV